MTYLPTALALAVFSSLALADADFRCMSDCNSRYSNDYCKQRCEIYKSGESSGGYQPEFGLGALNQGQQQADRESRQQLLMLLEALKIRAQADRQKQLQEQNSSRGQSAQQGIDVATQAARDFENGVLNYKGKKYDEALFLFARAAEAGHIKAKYAIGEMYLFGNGLPKDATLAYKWIKQAADQGDPLAQSDIGSFLVNGEGVAKDPVEGVKWLKKSADLGTARAQFSLSYCYFNGVGVEKNQSQSLYWLKKSAESGYAQAQNILGRAYLSGKMVGKNEDEGIKWLKKAVDQGNPEARELLINLGKN